MLKNLAIRLAYAIHHLHVVGIYSSLRRSLTKYQVAILMYHRVSPNVAPWNNSYNVHPRIFEKEIQFLIENGFNILPLEQLLDMVCNERIAHPLSISITFDDGYKDNFKYAYPILKKYNIDATIFLTTRYIGRAWPFHKARYAIWNTDFPNFFVRGLGNTNISTVKDRLIAMPKIEVFLDELCEAEKDKLVNDLLNDLEVSLPLNFDNCYTLSWKEIEEMNRHGIMFGAHTETHTNLTKLPESMALDEIRNSKNEIEKKIGTQCTLFSYPNGAFNPNICKLVKSAGFKFAVSASPGLVSSRPNPLAINRIPVHDNFYMYKAYLSGLLPDLITLFNYNMKR